MALREAGERYYNQNGGDPAVSAKVAGHTMLIKNKYYKKGSFEEAQESLRSIIRLLEKDGNAKASIVVHDKGYTIMTFIPPNETIRLK